MFAAVADEDFIIGHPCYRLDRDEGFGGTETQEAAERDLHEAGLLLGLIDQQALDLAKFLAVLIPGHPPSDVVGVRNRAVDIAQSPQPGDGLLLVAMDFGLLVGH